MDYLMKKKKWIITKGYTKISLTNIDKIKKKPKSLRYLILAEHIKHNIYNHAYREVIKLLLNSVSGKATEDPSRYFEIEWNPDNNWNKDEVKNDPNSEMRLINNTQVIRTRQTSGIHEWLIAGIMIYSYSKRLLFEYIHCLPNGSDDVTHIETDGIYFPVGCEEKYLENLVKYKGEYSTVALGKKIGNINLDKRSDQEASYFLGKKFYRLSDEKMALKGMPAKTIDKDCNSVQIVSKELYEQVHNEKPFTADISMLTKTLFTNNKHDNTTITTRIGKKPLNHKDHITSSIERVI